MPGQRNKALKVQCALTACVSFVLSKEGRGRNLLTPLCLLVYSQTFMSLVIKACLAIHDRFCKLVSLLKVAYIATFVVLVTKTN